MPLLKLQHCCKDMGDVMRRNASLRWWYMFLMHFCRCCCCWAAWACDASSAFFKAACQQTCHGLVTLVNLTAQVYYYNIHGGVVPWERDLYASTDKPQQLFCGWAKKRGENPASVTFTQTTKPDLCVYPPICQPLHQTLQHFQYARYNLLYDEPILTTRFDISQFGCAVRVCSPPLLFGINSVLLNMYLNPSIHNRNTAGLFHS